MKVEFNTNEIRRGKIYSGTLLFGQNKFFWLLVFTVPINGMNREVAKRTKRGEKVGSDKVRDELFTLVFLDTDWKEVDLGESRTIFLAEIVAKATNFHNAPVSDMWAKLSGGTCSSPFGVVESFEIEEEAVPAALR